MRLAVLDLGYRWPAPTPPHRSPREARARRRRLSAVPCASTPHRPGFSLEQPDLDLSTPTGGVRLRRRLHLIIAAVRGLYTIVRPTLITLACRAASNPPARRTSRRTPWSLALELLPNGLTACALLQVAASPGTSVVCKKSIKRHD